MIIRQRRIQNVDNFISGFKHGDQLFIGKEINDQMKEKITNIGFPLKYTNGENIVPNVIGPISNYNANGRWHKKKDLPKEKWYHELPYSVKDRGGSTHEGINYIERERYQRDFLPGPEVRMNVSEIDTLPYIHSGPFVYEKGSKEIKHAINLYLEAFGECELLDAQKRKLIPNNIIRLDRDILPQGEMPRSRMKNELGSWSNKAESKKEIFQWRLNEIAKYKPTFTAIGRAGFSGYCVFAFDSKQLYVLESMFGGNATYIFDGNRERLSQMTKAQILSQKLQKHRIIHRDNRTKEIKKILD